MSQRITVQRQISIHCRSSHCCCCEYGYKAVGQKLTCLHALNMRKLSHTQATVHNQEQNTEESTQHWRASKTKKPKTPARLPPCWQREFTSSNTRQPPKGRFPVFTVAKQRFTLRFICTVLSNVKTRKKACCPPTDWWWRVCLHRASELASPLTRAAKPKRSLITL